ncbi:MULTISPECIES: hypothetical protein [Sphingomonas]|uniref:hypothetical protein n=1 Tax=Sphingomonas TaxID=13687 RepID=UPI00082E8B6A|nr:hypothetical protein [Sphingomonas sp. CCH10-B3]
MNPIWSTVIVAPLAAFGFSGIAVAQTEIPVEVHFEGNAITRVVIDEGGRPTTLPPPDATRVYRGSVGVLAPRQVEKKIKVIVFYGNVGIPLVLNLTPGRPKLVVNIVNFTPPPSCFDRFLRSADQTTDNEFDAMRRMLTVAYAMRMDGSNCKAVGYERRAALIRHKRNENLATTSNGRYALNQEWKEELASLPRDAFSTPPTVLAERSQAEADNALFAYIYNTDIKKAATPAESLEVARNLKALRDSNPSVAAALATAPLDADIAYYERRANAAPK